MSLKEPIPISTRPEELELTGEELTQAIKVARQDLERFERTGQTARYHDQEEYLERLGQKANVKDPTGETFGEK